jgi:beta-galactosidase
MKKRSFLSALALTPLLAMCAVKCKTSHFRQRKITEPEIKPDGFAHTFEFGNDGITFLLDGRSFQVRSGEMHPSRIPAEYWRHRIQMAKAMGMNTIAIYIMWNYHETTPGKFDFSTENRDIVAFVRLCQEEGMWVLLRPGPYICGEWELGGLPSYLLRYDDIKLRVSSVQDKRYMDACRRYINELAPLVKPLLLPNGGPVLMIQIENEYASYGRDRSYLEELRQMWVDAGITGPFFTDDGVKQLCENRTILEGTAIALSGPKARDFARIREEFPGSMVMGGEIYPGFFTHWGDDKFQGSDSDISRQLADFMRYGLSFSLYVIHGGTNFGFTAGANIDPETGDYQPDITSYDYFAPINEQGQVTDSYRRYRTLIQSYLSQPLPEIPAALPTIVRYGSGALMPYLFTSIWDNLPEPIKSAPDAAPLPIEHHGQASGFVLYRKPDIGGIGGALTLRKVHDYATIFADGIYLGGISRTKIQPHLSEGLRVVPNGERIQVAPGGAVLDVLVEAMGRVNYGDDLIDRKGITEAALLDSNELRGWKTYPIPMDSAYLASLRQGCTDPNRPGLFFKATFTLDEIGDTFFDMRHWVKGIVWVNGRNLGRYWNIGPQLRLFCPASWLKKGCNEMTIFDLHQIVSAPIELHKTLI